MLVELGLIIQHRCRVDVHNLMQDRRVRSPTILNRACIISIVNLKIFAYQPQVESQLNLAPRLLHHPITGNISVACYTEVCSFLMYVNNVYKFGGITS